MRGDSLRDFYAKTLAVLGLGLIAGAGAIVDYWPTGVRLPDMTSPAFARITPPPLPQDLNQQIPAPAMQLTQVPVRSVSARHVRWPTFAPKPDATVASSRVATAAAPAQPAPELHVVPPPPVSVASYAAPTSDWGVEMVVVTGFSPTVLDDAAVPPATPTGFIGGALKKTKESLVKTGTVTGSSIADAFRGVVGAFKKVSPF